MLIEADGRTTWEPGPNRQVVASGGARGIPPTSLGATTIATMQWGAFQSTPTVMVPRLIPSFTSPNATPIPMPYDQPTTYSTPYTAPAANPYSAPTPATPAADPLLAAAADGVSCSWAVQEWAMSLLPRVFCLGVPCANQKGSSSIPTHGSA